MDSTGKAALRAYVAQGYCHELKSTLQSLWQRFRDNSTPDKWLCAKVISQQVVIIAERVDGLNQQEQTQIRPRKGTYRTASALSELKENVDFRVRSTTSKLDQLMQLLETTIQDVEPIADQMADLKNLLQRLAPTLDVFAEPDQRATALIEAEATEFVKLIRIPDAADPTATPNLADRFTAELVSLLGGEDSAQEVSPSDQRKTASPASQKTHSSPLSFLMNKVSGFWGSSSSEGSKSAPVAPTSPKPVEVVATAANSRKSAATSPTMSRVNAPPVSPRGESDSDSETVSKESSSVSRKLKGAASSLLRKAQKAVRGGSPSSPQPPKSVILSASSDQAPSSSSQSNYMEMPPSEEPPQPPNSPPTPRTDSSSSSTEGLTTGSTPPLSPRDSGGWAQARSSRILHPLNKRKSAEGMRPRSGSNLLAEIPPATPAIPTTAPSNKPPVVTPSSPILSSSPLITSISNPALSASTETIETQERRQQLLREEALQKEVADKFNLDGRIAQNEVRATPMNGTVSGREKRRAAIFTKATDRYSQLHSNLEGVNTSTQSDQSVNVNIWDEPEEGNLKIDMVDGKPEVASGTLNQLVRYLTSENHLDGRFVHTFLLTYNSFTTPRMLLEKLKQRYQIPENAYLGSETGASLSTAPVPEPVPGSSPPAVPPPTPPGATPSDSIAANPSSSSSAFLVDPAVSARRKLQLRVVNTLKKWLDISFLDFNDELIGQVFEFVDLLRKDGNAALAQVIDNILLTKLVGIRKKKDRQLDQPPPTPIIPKVGLDVMTVEDIDVVELARQMTLWDHECYINIKASELLKQAWNKPQLRHRSPRVLEMIERFNSISMWVAGCIVKPETAKDRGKIFERFILLANELYSLNNFNSMNAVMSGIGNAAVFRLQASKELIPTKVMKKYDKLAELMSSSQNFSNYRAALRAVNGPAVPYLGNYLSALVFIEDGNPDMVPGADPSTMLINFKKRRLVSRVIEEVQKYQIGVRYSFIQVDIIMDFLANLPEENDTELYDISLLREPRKQRQ